MAGVIVARTTAGGAPDVPADPGTPVAVSPFDGIALYNSPSTTADQARNAEPDPWRKAMLGRIADQPAATWIGDWVSDPAGTIRSTITAAKAAGQVPLLVIYAIPLRDLGSYSAGGSANAAAYRTFIDACATGLGGDQVFVVLEPDALPQLDGLAADKQTERLDLLNYATTKLGALAQAVTYLDVGNSTWKPAATMASRLTSAGVARIRGFATNVANFNPTDAEVTYGKAISAAVGDKPFVIDTSRNGLGKPPATGTDADVINPAGRALGVPPLSPEPDPLVDALLWVKIVGESDGNRAGAPPAGTFYPDYAVGLAERAQWANNTPLGTLEDDFADFDAAVWRTGNTNVTVTASGQLQIVAAPSYPAYPLIAVRDATSSWSAVSVVGVPTDPATTTTQAIYQLELDANNAVQVVWNNGSLVFRERVNGATAPGDVTVPYDPVAHKWWRLGASNGQTVWATSPDGVTWTVRRNKASAFSMRAVRPVLIAGNYGGATTTAAALFEGVASSSTIAPPPYYTTSTPWLPYDSPTDASWASLDDWDNPVAVHYMATQRRRINNRNPATDPASYEQAKWFPPGGTEGTTDHGPYGGLWRNGPASVPPDPANAVGASPPNGGTTTMAFELNDKVWELRQAKAAGIRLLTVDLLNASTFKYAQLLAQAASIVGGIKLAAMADCQTSITRNGPTNLADYCAQLAKGPYGKVWLRHTDGRFLLTTFGAELALNSTKAAFTDQQIIDYWRNWSSDMTARGVPACLWATFVRAWEDPTEHTATAFNDPQLDGIVVGFGTWGTRNPVETVSTSNNNAGAPARSRNVYGQPFMYTMAAWDARPNQSKFYESGGFENLLAAFKVARDKVVDFLQLATWNDRTEGTELEPSIQQGWNLLDIVGYFVIWHRFGVQPPILRDALYLYHRPMQTPSVSPQPTYGVDAGTYTQRMVRSGSTPERNQIDVLIFARAAGQVSVIIAGVAQTLTYGTTTGTSVTVPAGVSRVQCALKSAAAGSITATLKRSGLQVSTVTSPFAVSFTSQEVQNLDPYVVGSLPHSRTTS